MAWVIGTIGVGFNSVAGVGIVGVCLDVVPWVSFVGVRDDGVARVVVSWFGGFGSLSRIVRLDSVDARIRSIGEGGSKNRAKNQQDGKYNSGDS